MHYLTNFKIIRLLKLIIIFFYVSILLIQLKFIITKRLLTFVLLLKLIIYIDFIIKTLIDKNKIKFLLF